MRFSAYNFTVEGKKPFTIHPPFLYNTIKSVSVNQGVDLGEIVLDTVWWKEERTHTFTLTSPSFRFDLDELVHKAVDEWRESVGVDAEIAEYGFKEIDPKDQPVPDDIDHVLLETRSPIMLSFRENSGDRRYGHTSDLGDFSKLVLQLVRRYKELYGEMDQKRFDEVMNFSEKPEDVVYFFEYTDDFPLRKDRSLDAKNAMVGKTLFRAPKWNEDILKLLKLAETMHIGQKRGYGLGGIDITLLRKKEDGTKNLRDS